MGVESRKTRASRWSHSLDGSRCTKASRPAKCRVAREENGVQQDEWRGEIVGTGSERGRCGGGAFGRNWRHADEAGDIRET